MFAILGSGFGLYGYLPALVGLGERIALPQRYRDRFNSRPELAAFAPNVEWVPTEREALNRATGVVLAVRPNDQCEWLLHCLALPHITSLVLEKPIATTPEAAATLLGALKQSHKLFRVGYTFRYADWAPHLRDSVVANPRAPLFIEWSFLAHHFRYNLRNWKRFSAAGGGAIRFFGIHIIALLAELGYRDLEDSVAFGLDPDEIERWTATFVGEHRPLCMVAINTRDSSSYFRIATSANAVQDQVLVHQHDPFQFKADYSELRIDARVKVLREVCQSLWQDETNHHERQFATIALWRQVELKTQFKRNNGIAT